MNGIRKYREKKGLNQEQLAEAVGSSPDSIGRYERGERDTPSSILKKIAETCGCTMEELLTNPTPPPSLGGSKEKLRPIMKDRHKRKVVA
jgi:transcriptional regulator with XRE-family HTH domain